MIPIPSLPQALETGLRNKKDDWGDDKVHVSDLAVAVGEKCARQLWLRLNGYEKKEHTAGQLLMFDHGNRIHERLVEVIKQGLPEHWTIQAVEQEVSLGTVTGRYDTRMFNLAEGYEVIVDFKTTRGRAFNFLDKAKPAHILQVQAYMTGADADGGLVFYVDREGQNQARQFYVERDDEFVWWAVKNTKLIAHGKRPPLLSPQVIVRENKGPDSVYLKQPWNCDYCDYLDVSCEGALPRAYRDLGIVGKIKEGRFELSEGIPEEVKDMVVLNIDREEVAV